MHYQRYTLLTLLREALLWIGAALFAVPLYYLFEMSVKPAGEVFRNPTGLPSRLDFSSFSQVWNANGQTGATSIFGAFVNSVIITVVTVVLLALLGSLAGYWICRAKSRLATPAYLLFVAGLILPAQLGFLPLFEAMRALHLTGTREGVVLVYLGLFLPLSVFLFAGFIRALPHDYEEAAVVDRASALQTFIYVVAPLLRPVTATVAIICGLLIWNDFFTPLVFLSGSRSATLPVAIYAFVGVYETQWNLIFAGIVIALAPMLVVFLLTQKYLVRGVGSGLRG